MTKLQNGKPARAWSPAECLELEALAVLAMPWEARQRHLAAVEQHRGRPARLKLETTMRALWRRDTAAAALPARAQRAAPRSA